MRKGPAQGPFCIPATAETVAGIIGKTHKGDDMAGKYSSQFKEGLIHAASRGHVGIVRMLLEAGADVHAKDKYGATVLQHATGGRGSVECVKLLIDAGVDVNARGEDGNTALHWAAIEGHVECVRMLLEAGADVHAKGDEGYTALMLAMEEGNGGIVALLNDYIMHTELPTAGGEQDETLKERPGGPSI